ncbi:LAG1 longevity assurance homolog 3-like isoform X1 [Durio zibethinus]|uniref:LAG1 longevity assurance homolog 3-like isoform X1 n=1 Tax=Durio zibethinus TaxID=66656 RepID=A0A6P5YBP5_DURZI|nr:LAG1 longevity assurance homolog 3-like isoform X1 [Durio zibethinus]
MGLLGLFKSIDWESESYPQLNDFVLLPFFAFLFPSVRIFLDKFVFENLARRLVLGKAHTLQDVQRHDNRKKLNKFKESAWKCVYFFSSEILSIYVSYGEPWFTKTKYFWEGPGEQVWPDQKIKLKLKGLYMYAGGFYTYSLFALIFWETRRSDFLVSMLHHIATIILIFLSYIFRFGRVGSVTLALHEGSDVFLEFAKMSKYSGFEWLASFSFVLFALSWTIFRMILFPFWIIRSTSYEVLLILDKEKHMVDGSIYYYLFNTLLFCLLVVHTYWWVLMIRVIMRQIHSGGEVDDVRSDSEGEDEHDD